MLVCPKSSGVKTTGVLEQKPSKSIAQGKKEFEPRPTLSRNLISDMSSQVKLFFCRHCRSVWNLESVIWGPTAANWLLETPWKDPLRRFAVSSLWLFSSFNFPCINWPSLAKSKPNHTPFLLVYLSHEFARSVDPATLASSRAFCWVPVTVAELDLPEASFWFQMNLSNTCHNNRAYYLSSARKSTAQHPVALERLSAESPSLLSR